MSKTATLVRHLSDGPTAAQSLYRLTEPLEAHTLDDSEPAAYSLVVVSATTVAGRPEAYIFGADESGKIVDWMELPGSMVGTLSHADALARAGYVVAEG